MFKTIKDSIDQININYVDDSFGDIFTLASMGVYGPNAYQFKVILEMGEGDGNINEILSDLREKFGFKLEEYNGRVNRDLGHEKTSTKEFAVKDAQQSFLSIFTFFSPFEKKNILYVDLLSTHPQIKEFYKKLKENYKPYTAKKHIEAGTAYLLVSNDGRLSFQAAPKKISMDFPEKNYSKKVAEEHKYVLNHLVGEAPPGKIAIYQGSPGTGKTYLIRNLISSLENCKTVLCQASQIEQMAEPSFITMLLSQASDGFPIVFIVEDADEILSTRTGANMGSISTLLNFGDGILGNIFDVRIVCTTNTKIKEFDPAITRPGRLLKIVNVEELNAHEAFECGQNLIGNKWKISKPMTLAEVYEKVNRIKEEESK